MKTIKRTKTKPLAAAGVESINLRELKKLVAEGEGLQLEFKRKAAYPEKIVRELIAFANTEGGTLLIGVDDNKTIPGIKHPEEEGHVVREALSHFCRPLLAYNEACIAIPDNRFVIRFDVPPSSKRPHFLVLRKEPRSTFVRVKDMSIIASAEMEEVIRRSKKKNDIRFTFGNEEKKLMEYLDKQPVITLSEYRNFSGLNRFQASRKLILLVLANVLKIVASEKGDLYSRV
ncbi:MAG: ATP-binding protein [Cyclobacteriaceae bacterium]|nr:ATP-binding protein [Cyclobacteriaceae bacterium]